MGLVGKLLSFGVDIDCLPKERTVYISNAELRTLRATPKVLVPGQGSHTYLELLSLTAYFHAGTEVLTQSSDPLSVKYTNSSGTTASASLAASSFIDQAVDMIKAVAGVAIPVGTLATRENQPLVLHNVGDGEYGGNASNDARLTMKVLYRVWRF